jgi:hypothetical protein
MIEENHSVEDNHKNVFFSYSKNYFDMDQNIELKSINELFGMNFYIPNYQRGYRWKKRQVKDLLDDINEFINRSKGNHPQDNFYCLQPLVVKEAIPDKEKLISELPKDTSDGEILCKVKKAIKNNTRWEVIDGQQRLTTIYILLAVLRNAASYSIEYETRKGSKDFLSDIKENKAGENIDYYHIVEGKNTINEWFKDKDNEYKKQFKETLLNKVQFIWYESDEDSIKVFTRLNIGKIGLTNAELIKALFLNRSNFTGEDDEKVRLKQYEIASQWDRIEYTLQNDEFWLFLHNLGYTNPTRIDFIFDLMCDMGKLDSFIDWKKDKETDIGTDQYKTFRYFNAYFHSNIAKKRAQNNHIAFIEQCWAEISNIFQTFEEWFNDLELYHYVGYLIENGSKLNNILEKWYGEKDKEVFVNDLINEITKKIKDYKDLSQQYEINGGKSKTACKRLLLLYNIQTAILQNENNLDNYNLGVFYKFPFHLYKKEGWDVEHIDSNTENDLTKKVTQNEFLLNIYNGVSPDEQKKIEEFINNPAAKNFSDFEKYKNNSTKSLNDDEKNQIWNFTLLDSSTNRSYGNSIFSAKRRIIIGKDKGKLIPIPKIKNNKLVVEEEKNAQSSFIPPCTKQVFLKYYSAAYESPNYWEKSDAEAYRQDMMNTLKEFGVTISKGNSTKEEDNGK